MNNSVLFVKVKLMVQVHCANCVLHKVKCLRNFAKQFV
jgi:hypothetical protein